MPLTRNDVTNKSDDISKWLHLHTLGIPTVSRRIKSDDMTSLDVVT